MPIQLNVRILISRRLYLFSETKIPFLFITLIRVPGGVYLYRVVQMQASFYIICYFETDRKINFQSVSYHCEVA